MANYLRIAVGLFLLLQPVRAEERSPFEMVRYVKGVAQVEVNRRWYQLLEIDGIGYEKIAAACLKVDDKTPQKRFCEDLVKVLKTVGHDPGPTVTLKLRDVKTNKVVTKRDVAMTGANRSNIRDARPWQRPGPRTHLKRPAHTFKNLTLRHQGDTAGPQLKAAYAIEDLDQLEFLIENGFSYRELKQVDYRAALDTIRLGFGDSISIADFHIQLRKLVALFGDGHSRVRKVYRALPTGFLPFALADADGKIAALTAGGQPLDAAHPYVQKIDGVAIEKWMGAAARVEAAGSPQFVRRAACFTGAWANFVRTELGLKHRNTVKVTLASAKGKTKSWSGRIAGQPNLIRMAFRRPAEVLDGNIGYLPIGDMSLKGAQVDALEREFKGLLETKALVIDVRGNTGGRRDALLRLFPYFMKERVRVVNVAARRLPRSWPRGLHDGYLEDRYLYPATSQRLSEAQKAAIKALHFKPEWQPDAKLFSAWHYLVIERKDALTYDKPVVLLIDGACFSATDIFVGAFELLDNVTLMGSATGGGSGRANEFRLGRSRFRVKLSTMASFRVNGQLYDGRGIAPDVDVARTVADYAGRSDSVLEAALARLR